MIDQKITVHRNTTPDAEDVTVVVPGKWDDKPMQFGVKKNKELPTEQLLFTLKNELAGGVDEMTCSYNTESNKTTFVFLIQADHTAHFTWHISYWELKDVENSKVPAGGTFYVDYDVNNDLSGLPSDDYSTYVKVDINEMDDNAILRKVGNDLVETSLVEYKHLLGLNLLEATVNNYHEAFDIYNPQSIEPPFGDLYKRVQQLESDSVLELDEDGNVTLKN